MTLRLLLVIIFFWIPIMEEEEDTVPLGSSNSVLRPLYVNSIQYRHTTYCEQRHIIRRLRSRLRIALNKENDIKMSVVRFEKVASDTLEKKKKRIKELEKELGGMEQQCDGALSGAWSQARKIAKLERLRKVDNEEFTEKLKDLEQENRELASALGRLEAQKDELDDIITDLKQEVKNKDSEIEDLDIKIDNKRKKSHKLKDEMSALQDKIDTLEEMVDNTNDEDKHS